MRVNAFRFTAAFTPSALDSALCQLSCAACQLARPCATALLLIYTHSSLSVSVGGGGGGAGTDTGVLYGGMMGFCFRLGLITGVLFVAGMAGVAYMDGIVAGVGFGTGGSGRRPCASLFIFTYARDSGSVKWTVLFGLFARRVFASSSTTSAIYLSMIESSLSTDSEVEIVSMYAIGIAFSLPFSDGCGGGIVVTARIVLVVGIS